MAEDNQISLYYGAILTGVLIMHEFLPPKRILLGPGPSLVHPRVLRALATPLLGHLDPAFLAVMNDIQTLLRTVFQTTNRFTIAVSGTGSAGMEAAVVNLVEPGDTRSEEHTSELQSLRYLVCRLLLEKKKRARVSRLREPWGRARAAGELSLEGQGAGAEVDRQLGRARPPGGARGAEV